MSTQNGRGYPMWRFDRNAPKILAKMAAKGIGAQGPDQLSCQIDLHSHNNNENGDHVATDIKPGCGKRGRYQDTESPTRSLMS